jgi:hypothetical protein
MKEWAESRLLTEIAKKGRKREKGRPCLGEIFQEEDKVRESSGGQMIFWGCKMELTQIASKF